MLQHFFGGRARGHNVHLETVPSQAAQDIVFDAKIVRHNRHICRGQGGGVRRGVVPGWDRKFLAGLFELPNQTPRRA